MVPKRITYLTVTADFVQQSDWYRRLGFERIDVDDPECLGFVAGETGLILETLGAATACYGRRAAETLQGRPVPYIHVDRLDPETVADWDVLADVVTRYGTRELVIESRSGPMILAELLPQPPEGPGSNDGRVTAAAGR